MELRVEAVVLAVLGGKVSVAEADPLSAISGVEGAFDLVVMATHGRRLKRVGDVRACRGLVP